MLLPLDNAPAVCSRLRSDLLKAVPPLSSRAQGLIDSMLRSRGSIGCAQTVASHVGLRDRFQLARWLVAEGLPPLHELAGWVAMLCWLERIERTGVGLCAVALSSGKDPAACYRLVRRLTGQSWGAVRALGLQWAVEQFAARCRLVARRWGVTRNGSVLIAAGARLAGLDGQRAARRAFSG